MREKWLSNSVFETYDEILDHCYACLEQLIEQPARIKSIGVRDRAHRSGSVNLGIRRSSNSVKGSSDRPSNIGLLPQARRTISTRDEARIPLIYAALCRMFWQGHTSIAKRELPWSPDQAIG